MGEETQPAEDTLESQKRLLADRPALARRYARFDMSRNSRDRSPHDYYGSMADDVNATVDELYKETLSALEKLPDKLWNNRDRENVRPKGESVSKQITLGLVMGANRRRIPTVTQKTLMLTGLTKLLLRYVNALANKQGLSADKQRLEGTSIQLTWNMPSRPHKDKGNQGMSFATAVGDFKGGQLCVHDPEAEDDVKVLDDDTDGIGKAGFKFPYRKHAVKKKIVRFNGKDDIHFTAPFIGTRGAIILFSIGTKSYQETAPLNRQLLQEFGFRVPALAVQVGKGRLSSHCSVILSERSLAIVLKINQGGICLLFVKLQPVPESSGGVQTHKVCKAKVARAHCCVKRERDDVSGKS